VGGTHKSPCKAVYNLPLQSRERQLDPFAWTLLDAKNREGKCNVIAMEVDMRLFDNHKQDSETKEKRMKNYSKIVLNYGLMINRTINLNPNLVNYCIKTSPVVKLYLD
jgi:hypothetical protein